MAEEARDQAAQAEESEGAQPREEATDWKAKYEAMRAHSRDWEKKAKENADATAELEKLREEKTSEQAEAEERASKAEAELAELKARAERAETVAAVADKANVPAEVVGMLNGADAEELADQVKRLLKLLPAYPTRTDDGGARAAGKKTGADRLAEAFGLE